MKTTTLTELFNIHLELHKRLEKEFPGRGLSISINLQEEGLIFILVYYEYIGDIVYSNGTFAVGSTHVGENVDLTDLDSVVAYLLSGLKEYILSCESKISKEKVI